MQVFTLPAEALESYDPRTWNSDLERVELAAAEHAVAAYLDEAPYAEAAKAAGFIGAQLLDNGSSQVVVAWCQKTIVIAARGSHELGDWRDDIGSVVRFRWDPILPREWTFADDDGAIVTEPVAIGWGFRRQCLDIGPKLLDLIGEIRVDHPSARIVLTGHSLGAAMVRPLVAYLRYAGIQVSLAIGFEEPRVGNAAWARWYEDTFDRENSLDPLTPSWSVINVVEGSVDLVTQYHRRYLGFRHAVPRRRVFHDEDETRIGPEAWRNLLALNPVPRWRFITRSIRGGRAHFGRTLVVRLRAKYRTE